MKTPAHPFVLAPIAVPKPWGGHALAELFGYQTPGQQPIGEVWALSSLAARPTVVHEGPLKGATLDEARSAMGQSILADGPFPILVKFLEAVEPLSVQVHPDDTYAQERDHSMGKTECWRILRVAPGAAMYYGLAPGVGLAAVSLALLQGRLDAPATFARITPRDGQFIPIPPGTLHTAWGGIVWAEIQTAADLTYRLWDWDRREPGRELAVEKGLAVLRPQAPPAPHVSLDLETRPGLVRTLHWATRHFVVEELLLGEEWQPRAQDHAFALVVPLDGDIGIAWAGGKVIVAAGRVAYVPRLADGFGLGPRTVPGMARALLVYQADPAREIVPMLVARGLDRARIAALVLDRT